MASYYVIERISNALEEDNSKGQEVFEKFSQRYPEDSKLIRIYNKFKSKIASPNQEDMIEVKKSLERLKSVRKLKNGDSIAQSYMRYLWYKNRVS